MAVARVRNTLALDRVAVSPNLQNALDPARVAVERELDVEFDTAGRLISPFARELTARS